MSGVVAAKITLYCALLFKHDFCLKKSDNIDVHVIHICNGSSRSVGLCL